MKSFQFFFYFEKVSKKKKNQIRIDGIDLRFYVFDKLEGVIQFICFTFKENIHT